MCGIVAYIGHREAYPVILKGLKRLEYRGYDSSGVALLNDGLKVYKKKGKVAELEESLIGREVHSNSGHNGIIENYALLKQELVKKGYTFTSDTDTEVLLKFIEDIQVNNQVGLEEAVRIALRRVVGAYVIVLIDQDNPDTLIAARKGSPLVIGIGKDEHFLASDASPIIEYTKEVVYVNDYELAIIRPDELVLKNLGNEKITPFIQKLDLELAKIEKGGFDHFMLKEIFEQPETIFDCLRGRMDAKAGHIRMAGVDKNIEQLKNANRFNIIACGTSWHAGLIA